MSDVPDNFNKPKRRRARTRRFVARDFPAQEIDGLGLDVLAAVHRDYVLDTPQIFRLFDCNNDKSKDKMRRRLFTLFHCGLIHRPRRLAHEPLFHQLTQAGGRVLAEAGIIPAYMIPGRRHKQARDYHHQHVGLRNNLRIALTLYLRENAMTVPTWDGAFVVRVGEDSVESDDSFIVPNRRKGRTMLFVEADRSKMTRAVFAEKLEVYDTFYRHRGYTQYQAQDMAVLVITETLERAASLKAYIKSPVAWFTCQKFYVRNYQLLGEPIWKDHDNGRHMLFE